MAMFKTKCNNKDSDFIHLLNVSNWGIIWSSLKRVFFIIHFEELYYEIVLDMFIMK